MSAVGKAVGAVAGVVATIAPFFGPVGAIVGTVAAGVAVVANVATQLTTSKPPARGNVSEVRIGANLPTPYLIGRTYTGGNLLRDVGYGATRNNVPNPYLAQAVEYSGCGPVDGLEQVLADYSPVTFAGNAATGYFGGFLHRAAQLGHQPSPAALSGPWGAIPGWATDAKLSGHAAILFSALFDKDGKVFSSGLPQLGAIWRGVKVYDPRLDSTFPGGSGPQRWSDEATWAFSENPGLHGLAYARGRYAPNGKKLFGIGLPRESIIIEHFVTLANVCDANGWKVGGVIHEPAARWTNLKDILAAGGAEPAFAGARLGLNISMPRVAVDRITEEDLASDDVSVSAMRGWRERLNGIIPRWRSEAAKWEYVPGDLVSVSSYVAEDGEPKEEERQYNLVQHGPQAAQLAAYDLVNGRELGPIEILVKPRFRRYPPGTCLIVHLPDDGLVEQPAVIINRGVDTGEDNFSIALTLVSETAAKHDFALGRTSVPPATPSIVGTEELDEVTRGVGAPTYEDGTPIDDVRPAEPGATVGAPNGTPVGNRTSDEVNAELDARRAEIEQAIAAANALAATVEVQDGRITEGRGLIDQAVEDLFALEGRVNEIVAGGDVGDLSARVRTVESVNADQNSAIAGIRQIIESGSDSNAQLRASLTAQAVAYTSADKAIADSVAALRTDFNGTTADFNQRLTTVSDGLGASVQRTTRLEARQASVLDDSEMRLDVPPPEAWARDARAASAVPIDSRLIKTTAYDNASCLFWHLGVGSVEFYARWTIPVDPRRRYRISTRVGAYRGQAGGTPSVFYIGFVCLDGAGNPLDHGGHGTWRYAAIVGEPIPNTGVMLERSNIVTGEGNDSWVKFAPGTKQVRLMGIMDYHGNSDCHSYLDYIRFDDIEGEAQAFGAVARLDGNEFARTTAIDAIVGRVSSAETNVGSVTARLNGSEFARSTTTDAIAQRAETANARAGGLESTVSTQAIAIADAAGKLAAARLTLQAASPGGIARIGIQSDNAAGSEIIFGADNISFEGRPRFRSGNSGARIEFIENRLVITNGVVMLAYGPGFGDNSQFLEWIGPHKGSLAECSAADSLRHTMVDGSGYYGGALRAGVITVPVRNTSTADNIGVATGPFGSNGRTRVVTASVYFYGQVSRTNQCPVGTPPPTVVLELFRGDDASGELLVSREMTGRHECVDGFGQFEQGYSADEMSASFNFTDNSGGTSARFFARIRNRRTNVNVTNQTLSLISIEQ